MQDGAATTNKKKGRCTMTQAGRKIRMLMVFALVMGGAGLAGAAEMMEEKPMHGMLAGSKDHHASGKIVLDKDMKGNTTLTLSDIKIDKVPDGYVYLTKGGDWRKGVELSKLEQFTGAVSFPLPMGVMADDFDTVVIWCKQFNAEIGRGALPGKTMMK
ncbi:MAG: DM13 domain-containing protein [Desulfobacterales bacterium]|nr:DM13 domain-containing protein [Desulfobacterales bacterium]